MNAEQESIYSNRASQIVNILKGLAIWMVLTMHFSQNVSFHPLITALFNTLQLGCQIFFTLSCFTLCLSYQKSKLSYWQYFKKRVLKLFLAYYVMILFGIFYRLSIAVRGNHSIIDAINIKGVLVNMLFLNGLVPSAHNDIVRGGWFIGTLFILYLLFPLLYKIFNWQNEKWEKCKIFVFPLSICFVSGIIIGFLYFFVPNFFTYYFFIYTNFINQICCFCIGFVLFHLYKTVKIKQVKLPFLKALIAAGLALFFVMKIIQFHFIIVVTLVGLATMYMFIFLFNNAFTKDNLDSELIMRFLSKSGKISLGIYYTHMYLVDQVTRKLIKIVYKIDTNPHFFVKLLIAIVIYVACYWVGKIFSYLIGIIQDKINAKFLTKKPSE